MKPESLALTRALEAALRRQVDQHLTLRDPGRWEDKFTPSGYVVPHHIQGRLLDDKRDGWPTPLAHDAQGNSGGWLKGKALPDVAQQVAGVEERFPGAVYDEKSRTWKVNGRNLQLNPRLSCWLMGLPPEWGECGRKVYRALKNSRAKPKP
jgi:hypothetical protein